MIFNIILYSSVLVAIILLIISIIKDYVPSSIISIGMFSIIGILFMTGTNRTIYNTKSFTTGLKYVVKSKRQTKNKVCDYIFIDLNDSAAPKYLFVTDKSNAFGIGDTITMKCIKKKIIKKKEKK